MTYALVNMKFLDMKIQFHEADSLLPKGRHVRFLVKTCYILTSFKEVYPGYKKLVTRLLRTIQQILTRPHRDLNPGSAPPQGAVFPLDHAGL